MRARGTSAPASALGPGNLQEAYRAKRKEPLNFICRQNRSRVELFQHTPHPRRRERGENKPLTEKHNWNSSTTTTPGGRCPSSNTGLKARVECWPGHSVGRGLALRKGLRLPSQSRELQQAQQGPPAPAQRTLQGDGPDPRGPRWPHGPRGL